MKVKRTRIWLNDIPRHPDWFAFLLRGFIKLQRVPVYPVEPVFLGEIRGKDNQLYALDATKYFACLAVNTHSRHTALPASRTTPSAATKIRSNESSRCLQAQDREAYKRKPVRRGEFDI